MRRPSRTWASNPAGSGKIGPLEDLSPWSQVAFSFPEQSWKRKVPSVSSTLAVSRTWASNPAGSGKTGPLEDLSHWSSWTPLFPSTLHKQVDKVIICNSFLSGLFMSFCSLMGWWRRIKREKRDWNGARTMERRKKSRHTLPCFFVASFWPAAATKRQMPGGWNGMAWMTQ